MVMKQMKKIPAMILIVFVLCASGATIASAQYSGPTDDKSTAQANPTNSGSVLSLQIKNPLNVSTIQEAVRFFVNTIVKLAIPVIVFFFLYSGFMLILAQGKPEAIAKARRMFFYTLIGTLLVLGAWSITNAIVGTVNTIAK